MIKILDPTTINQIAAGEVIENAASVIKELVENSLDAQARTITVEITSGGRQLIRVTDDGVGIKADEASLAFERHATSKLHMIDDLCRLETMGFRGEALAAIASVSSISLTTSPKNQKGSLVRIEAGKILESQVIEAREGSKMEVRNLFFNQPARRKFQKSINHDIAEALKVITLQALAHPNVSFTLISNEQILLRTEHHKATLQGRIQDVLGKDFASQMLSCSFEENGIQLEGFFSKPEITRPNRSGQYLFINNRPIYCPFIATAILKGYDTLIEPRRYPLFVLHLHLPPDQIDVNVHPQKKEVRLRNESQLFSLLIKTVQIALRPQKPLSFPVFSGFTLQREHLEVSPPKNHVIPSHPVLPGVISVPLIIGLWNDYILIDSKEKGLTFVDSRALRTLLLLEESKKPHEMTSQELLFPIKLEFSIAETASLKMHIESLPQFGIKIRSFGKNTFIIDALPEGIGEEEVKSLLLDLLRSQEEPKEEIAFLLAERMRPLSSLWEAESLLRAWTLLNYPSFAPKGKAIAISLQKSDIAKHENQKSSFSPR